jgi:hypothetical protein
LRPQGNLGFFVWWGIDDCNVVVKGKIVWEKKEPVRENYWLSGVGAPFVLLLICSRILVMEPIGHSIGVFSPI